MIAVIGVGSVFGQDNIAELVIDKINERRSLVDFKHNIKIEYYDRPGLYLLEIMKPFNEVHLVDAIVGGKKNGSIHRYSDINLLKKQNTLLSNHAMGVAEALLLGETLNCLPKKLIIHGIEIDVNDKNREKLIDECDYLANKIINEIEDNK